MNNQLKTLIEGLAIITNNNLNGDDKVKLIKKLQHDLLTEYGYSEEEVLKIQEEIENHASDVYSKMKSKYNSN